MTDRDLPAWMRENLSPDGIDEVVTRLNRVRPKAQKQLAKDIVTIAYLEAGRRLIEQRLEESDSDEKGYTFLDWLTRDVIYAEMTEGPDPLPRQPSDGTFRDRWRSKDHYLADLIGYIHWHLHREPNRQLARDSAEKLLNPAAQLAMATEDVAYQDLLHTTDAKQARLMQLAIQSLAAANSGARINICKIYLEMEETWKKTYSRVLKGRRMSLRPDVTFGDIAIILNSVADGLAMRASVDGVDRIMNRETRTSLLGTAALALWVACIDHGDGRSMRDLVNELGQRFPPARDPDDIG
jgi:hypothetical protein